MIGPSSQQPSRQATFWLPLYHLVLYPLFLMAMRLAAFWSPKIRRGLVGRRNWRNIASTIADPDPRAFRVHIHAASAGEFEQAKPLIEALRAEGRPYRITASFFSASGLEQHREYPLIDGACYLPLDRASEMNALHNLISPDLIIVVRYDLWPEFLRQAWARRIPIVLVCGVLRDDSSRFYPVIRGFFEFLYRYLTAIYCVGRDDRAAFERLVPDIPVEVAGDTRFDRVVLGGAGEKQTILPQEIVAGRCVLVAGSTWPADEALLVGLESRADLLSVIVPHEPTAPHIADLREKFSGSVTLSEIERGDITAAPSVVIVDRTGVLLKLYGHADIAYVGGAFGEGVHSVLEPASYGIPVLSGPRIERSRDAVAMREHGALTTVTDAGELRGEILTLLDDASERQRRGEAASGLVRERVGATRRIIDSLHARGLLERKSVGLFSRSDT